MVKQFLFWIILVGFSVLRAQETPSNLIVKKIVPVRDTLTIDSLSIHPNRFTVLDKKGIPIDSTFYSVNFQKGFLVFNAKNQFQNDTLTVRYLKFPDFLTKEYALYDKSMVVSNDATLGDFYAISKSPIKKYIPFDGLNTSGSISRGITIGNNQNTVVNSALDLQISGKIAPKVTLRASIQDSSIPLQEGGYSQKLDEFDQIFIELFSDKWNIRAGDLFLENRKSRFLNFNKKVQGLSTRFDFGRPEAKTSIFAAAALVRGQYAKSNFIGKEGNESENEYYLDDSQIQVNDATQAKSQAPASLTRGQVGGIQYPQVMGMASKRNIVPSK